MERNRNFIAELKYELRQGKMTNRLIIINVGVFIIIQICSAFARLGKIDAHEFIHIIFALDTKVDQAIQHPWGIITSIFSHFDFIHLAFNMLFLYFAGKIHEETFNGKQLLYTYIIGGIFGGLAEILIQFIFYPDGNPTSVIGASGSIMALFAAVAFHRPNTKVFIFSKFSIRIYFLALLFLIQDIVGIGKNDGVAHFAHIGGALFGVISVYFNAEKFQGIFKPIFTKTKNNTSKSRPKSDEEYNTEKINRQIKTDIILDKIAKGGYDSLTKSEKDFLFNQSKNGK